jgi:riboflavin kinase/FMN adenylyltransferase
MKIIRSASELGTEHRPVCLAIGFFDGVHLGHQQIIRQTITDARQHDAIAIVITFDRHPASVVAPARAPALIHSLHQKIATIESLNPDTLLLIHFDTAFSEQPAEAFIRSLVRDFGRLRSLCVGASFTFGHHRQGTVGLLEKLGRDLDFTVHGLAAVSLDGVAISSTRVREAIRTGHLDRAGQMLGRTYTLAGNVLAGDQLGRKLGFPTANLDVAGLVLPPGGVYATRTQVQSKWHPSVTNIGTRPTLDARMPGTRVESHLFDFSREIYGETAEILFVEKLRDERKFASLDELKAQIAQDAALARTRL